ncbi:UNVERIFIED_CONTAM: hypothetical protein HDU68_002094 [Siphonaria sp. JEL0065]|nr:hypothetical protein HDU68_002094 [Siphonaria sp. JEL0065]
MQRIQKLLPSPKKHPATSAAMKVLHDTFFMINEEYRRNGGSILVLSEAAIKELQQQIDTPLPYDSEDSDMEKLSSFNMDVFEILKLENHI